MILGLTHREDGTVIQRLTIGYKVSIGIPAGDGKNFPQKDDHFHIRAKNASGEWVDDKELMADLCTKNMKPGVPLREFDAVFLNDSEGQDNQGHWLVPESIFRTELAWWATSEKKCSGDGRIAQRSVSIIPKADQDKHSKGQRYASWTPCGEVCPDLAEGRCKPSGRLFFIFKDRPIMGSVVEYSTTSYETIGRIQSSLVQIMSVTGGRLRGIPLKVVIRPGKTSYVDPQGKRKSGTAFFVNIEFRQSDFALLVPKLLEHSAQYSQSISAGKRLLSEHINEEDSPIDATIAERSESEVAGEMTSEFFPENRVEAGHSEVNQGALPRQNDDDAVIASTFVALNLNPAQQGVLAHSLKGDIGEIRKWITAFHAGVQTLKMAPAQIHEFYTRIVLTPDQLPDALVALAKPSDGPTAKRTRKSSTPAAPAPTPTQSATVAAAPAAEPETPALTDDQMGSFNF